MLDLTYDTLIHFYEFHVVFQLGLLAYLLGMPSKGRVKQALVHVYMVYLVHVLAHLGWVHVLASPDATHWGIPVKTWARLGFTSMVLVLWSFMYFWYILLNRPVDWVHRFSWIAGTVLLAILFLNDSLFEVTNGDIAKMMKRPTALFALFYTPFYAYGCWLLWTSFRETEHGIERKRMGVILAAFGLALLAAISSMAFHQTEGGNMMKTLFTLSIGGIRSILLLVAIQFLGWIRLDLDSAAQDIFKEMKEPVLLIDRQGNVTRFNPSAQSLFQIPERHQAGGSPIAARAILPQYWPDFQRFEAPIDTPSGRRSFICIGNDIHRQGHNIGRMLLMRDVTRERELIQAKSEFTSTVSHELRTPLTSMLGFTKLIQKRFENGILPQFEPKTAKSKRAIQQIQNNLRVMEQEGTRLTRLINDVLDLSKIEAGKLDWNLSTHPSSTVLHAAANELTTLFDRESSVELVVQIDEPLPMATFDSARIHQVMENFLISSLALVESGIITLHIFSKGDGIQIEVQHEGQTIPERDAIRIFDKYPDTNDVVDHHVNRQGFGLALAKDIMTYHGGHIGVHLNEGPGNRFAAWLPLHPDATHTDRNP